jgi:CHASE3 domain sensor protein
MVLAASTSAFDQPGTLGFLVVFGMGVALYFVFRSMARHLRKVNTAAREEAAAAHAESSASGPATPADGPPSR